MCVAPSFPNVLERLHCWTIELNAGHCAKTIPKEIGRTTASWNALCELALEAGVVLSCETMSWLSFLLQELSDPLDLLILDVPSVPLGSL